MVIASKEVTQAISDVVKKNMPYQHYRVFLFGSRVTGRATKRSDYDVGVEASKKIPLTIIFKIKNELDAFPILQKIDLVDFKSVSKSFSNFAKKKVQVIYEQ